MRISSVTRLGLQLVFVAGLLNIATAQVWTPVPEIGREPVNDLFEHEGILYAATIRIVYRSSDGGRSWTAAEDFPRVDPHADVTSLAENDGRLFAGTAVDGVYASTDGGQRWERFSDGLGGTSRRVFDLTVRRDTLFATTDGDGVWARDLRSSAPWRPFNNGLGWTGGWKILTHGDLLCALVTGYTFLQREGEWYSLWWNEFGSQQSAFALHVHDGMLFGGTFTGMYRWNGQDERWTLLSLAPAPSRGVSAFASHEGRLFASLQLAVERHMIVESTDNGDSWTLRDDTQGEVHALHVAGGMLWSARTDGLWFRPLDAPASLPGPPVPAGVRLHPPYPQPATSIAVFSFELEQSEPVVLHILDALGRTVATLIDGAHLPPGPHRAAHDLSRLAPGCYALRLQTPTGVATRLLLRR